MRFLNENKRALAIKLFFLIVFCLYSCSVSFFTHTHIINGVTIVHSHFYTTDDDGKPTHEHTGAEIQLINSLSIYFVAGLIVAFILILAFDLKPRLLVSKSPFFVLQSIHREYSRLRPPPVL